jgi:hypothetical protein
VRAVDASVEEEGEVNASFPSEVEQGVAGCTFSLEVGTSRSTNAARVELHKRMTGHVSDSQHNISRLNAARRILLMNSISSHHSI